MSTTLEEPAIASDVPDVDDTLCDALEYRALHSGAIIGALLGVVSVVILFAAGSSLTSCLMLLPIPIAGVAISVWATRAITRNADQFVGLPAARAGLIMSIAFGVTGMAYGGYVYVTEVPDGYNRISFLDLKPTGADERADRIMPTDTENLIRQGEPIFIKGYIRPDSVENRKNAREFLFVRDSNTCCYGDLAKVKYYDQIQVVLTEGKTVNVREGHLYRLGGRLIANPANLTRGPEHPVYALVGDYVQD